MQRYDEAQIPTYTELILGLPGETYDSFADGLDRVLRAGQHHGLYVYLALLLPNSEMADPAYIAKHGLVSVEGPLLQQHATPDSSTPEERGRVVIGTKTMPPEDWLRAYLLEWAVQTLHCLGITTKQAINQAFLGGSYQTLLRGPAIGTRNGRRA